MMLTKCKKCGNNDFIVKEILFHNATIEKTDGRNILMITGDDGGGFDMVECKECGERYDLEEFEEIEYNN